MFYFEKKNKNKIKRNDCLEEKKRQTKRASEKKREEKPKLQTKKNTKNNEIPRNHI